MADPAVSSVDDSDFLVRPCRTSDLFAESVASFAVDGRLHISLGRAGCPTIGAIYNYQLDFDVHLRLWRSRLRQFARTFEVYEIYNSYTIRNMGP